MSEPLAVTLAATANLTMDGAGDEVDIGALRRSLQIAAHVTGYTPTTNRTGRLVLTLQTRASATDTWLDVDDAIAITAKGDFELSAGGLHRYIRIAWALTDLTSVDVGVDGEAHVTYCDPADLTAYAVPARSIREKTPSELAASCIEASDEADGYLGSAFTLPLTAWGKDLRKHCANLAAATLFRVRGADPSGPDQLVFDGRDQAIKWLDRIANGRLSPPGIVDSTPETFDAGSYVSGSPRRGW